MKDCRDCINYEVWSTPGEYPEKRCRCLAKQVGELYRGGGNCPDFTHIKDLLRDAVVHITN
jgi:hypothetical protein